MVTYAVDPAHFSFFLLFGFSFSAPDSDIPVTKYVFRFGIVSFLDSDKFPRGNKSFIDSKLAGEIARNTRRGVVKLQSFHDLFHRDGRLICWIINSTFATRIPGYFNVTSSAVVSLIN
jgi:hypothetical protein